MTDSAANVRHTPLAPYDGTDQQVIDTLWGADAVFCTRCIPGVWHHRDYHKTTRRCAVAAEQPATAAQREGQTMTHYPVEVLAEDDDDGTMVESKAALEQAVVGHRIVSVEKGSQREGYHGLYGGDSVTVLTLDNGQQVRLVGEGDCCAYTDVEKFLLHPERVDHIITGVGTTDGYTTWHIYADMGDVLELTVNWSCGNPFYYAYGFTIQVEPVPDGT